MDWSLHEIRDHLLDLGRVPAALLVSQDPHYRVDESAILPKLEQREEAADNFIIMDLFVRLIPHVDQSIDDFDEAIFL